MNSSHVYEYIADAFCKEGVDHHFTLTGDGNMHFATALIQRGIKTFRARHEHNACAMAMGYHSLTGNPGTASVTCGPGLTQLATILTTAAHASIPLIVFTGEAPLREDWHVQRMNQRPLVEACGARYIEIHAVERIENGIREAFVTSRMERIPVVIGVPYDLQNEAIQHADYMPSLAFLPASPEIRPNDAALDEVASLAAAAASPIVIAGRGVRQSGSKAAVKSFADRIGAILATTLPAKGLFDDHAFSIGVAGGFSSDAARGIFARADLVIGFGASFSSYTIDKGTLFPRARVVRIDNNPFMVRHGRPTSDLIVTGDIDATINGLMERLGSRQPQSTIRSDALAERIAAAPRNSHAFGAEPHLLDPRDIMERIDAVVPKDWHIVSGSGHSSYFYTHLRNREDGHFHAIREFGAIGNSLGIAIGIAAAKGDGKVLLLDGDGGTLMHIQELETLRSSNIKLLIGVLNDGAYGAELHKLREQGVDPACALFDRVDFRSIARGFGLAGAQVLKTEDVSPLFDAYIKSDTAAVWDIGISDEIVSPRMKRLTTGLGS